eukprot:scaffold130921_cov70-Phaeocystis_antarctica.AAC.5
MSAVRPSSSTALTSRPGVASSAVTAPVCPSAAACSSSASSLPSSGLPQRPRTARAASATSCAPLSHIACRNTCTPL